MPTINAFTMKPSVTQILAYVMVLLGILVFYTCITTNISSITANIVFSTLYGLSVLLLIIFATICSYLDPTDPIIQQYKQSLKNRTSFDSDNYYYCGICQGYCNESSKHCRTCKRCVVGFDHHCIWINNCIGQNNYRYFILMIVFVFIKFGIYIASVIYLSIQRRFMQYLAAMIASWVYLLFALILGFLNMMLLTLHIYLNFKGITTFQFIKLKNQQEHQKKLQKLRKQAQNQISEQKLNQISQVQLNQQDSKKTKDVSLKNSSIKSSKEQKTNPIIEKQVIQIIPQKESQGNVSRVHNNKSQVSISAIFKPKVSLSKLIIFNKSLTFVANSSMADIQQPRRILKTTNSQIL